MTDRISVIGEGRIGFLKICEKMNVTRVIGITGGTAHTDAKMYSLQPLFLPPPYRSEFKSREELNAHADKMDHELQIPFLTMRSSVRVLETENALLTKAMSMSKEDILHWIKENQAKMTKLKADHDLENDKICNMLDALHRHQQEQWWDEDYREPLSRGEYLVFPEEADIEMFETRYAGHTFAEPSGLKIVTHKAMVKDNKLSLDVSDDLVNWKHCDDKKEGEVWVYSHVN